MTTLDDAIATGQGNERPFNCMMHVDANASASVNLVKGVWFCHSCLASGTVDGKKAPSVEALQVLSQPEKTARIYPTGFLRLYDTAPGSYWSSRFSEPVIAAMRLGSDPFSGDATFPVHTGEGRLAGVGRRSLTDPVALKEAGQPRYRYPHTWSASSAFFGNAGRFSAQDIVVLVEGAADATAVHEVGAYGLACYGAGLHIPQCALLTRFAPKLVLLGFDMDEAGERAVERAKTQIPGIAPMMRVSWSGGDPAATQPQQRTADLLTAVRRARYRGSVLPNWRRRTQLHERAYARSLEEA